MIQGKKDHRFAIDWCLKIRVPGRKPFRIGLTVDSLGPAECTYMFRAVLWLEPLICFRLHHIMRDDNDTHLHDHPWWFFTFPLGTYYEWVPLDFESKQPVLMRQREREQKLLIVKGWRLHYRPAKYKHAVVLASTVKDGAVVSKPAWTFVITGTRLRDWGFWVKDQFVKWTAYDRMFGQTARPCSDPQEKQNAA